MQKTVNNFYYICVAIIIILPFSIRALVMNGANYNHILYKSLHINYKLNSIGIIITINLHKEICML